MLKYYFTNIQKQEKYINIFIIKYKILNLNINFKNI